MAEITRRLPTPLNQVRQYVLAWKSSGLTQAEYELTMGYTKGTMGRWVHRIKLDEESGRQQTSPGSHLRPIEIRGPLGASQYNPYKEIIEVIIHDRLRIRFSAAAEVSKITALLKGLQSCN